MVLNLSFKLVQYVESGGETKLIEFVLSTGPAKSPYLTLCDLSIIRVCDIHSIYGLVRESNLSDEFVTSVVWYRLDLRFLS